MSNVPALRSYTSFNGLVIQECQYDMRQLYPVDLTESLQLALREFAVKVPFTRIVDKSMGISTCRTCGSRYAGQHEGKCTHKGYFFQVGNWDRTNYINRSDANKSSSYYNKVTEVYDTCNGYAEWDLQKEFNEQESFFRTIERAYQNYQPAANFEVESGIMHYEANLPPGLAAHLENNYLKSVVRDMKHTLEFHHQALKEISERMQSAGHALLNGGRF